MVGFRSVSVVIPVYNRAETLRRALDSLVLQTDPDFDVHVCDDGSSENIQAVVNEFRGKLVIDYQRIERSGGPARARNVGLANARGEWVSMLDSDDWWQPNRIAHIKNYLVDTVDVVFHPLFVIRSAAGEGAGERRVLVGQPVRSTNVLRHMLRFGNPLATSGTLVRAALMREIGGFYADELGFIDDFDAWLRLASHGARFRFISKPLGYYWVGHDNISFFSKLQYRREINLFDRQLSLLPEEYQRVARSNFNYLIGSYELTLGLPDTGRLAQVELSVEPLRWLMARAKLVRRRLMQTKSNV